MATWPSTLPQRLQRPSYEQQFPDGSIRQDMDSGPAFQRQRFTAAPERISGDLIVDRAQYATLLDFWKNTTAHGSLSFDWMHPITENAATVQFDVSNSPRLTALSGRDFTVSITIEVLP